MKTTKLQQAWHYNRLLKKKLLAAEAEIASYSVAMGKMTEFIARQAAQYSEALEAAKNVAEEAILDRGMYKQHSLDLAKELEQMREPEWNDEEDYLPAPAEGYQCSFCKGE